MCLSGGKTCYRMCSEDCNGTYLQPTLPQASHVTTSDSPPPPRRSHHGKTLIVPLNASRYRVPVTPLLGTPDSRITSFEAGTTKSCATIPEDDEDESPSCERIDDLISIDRVRSLLLIQRMTIQTFKVVSFNILSLFSFNPSFVLTAFNLSSSDDGFGVRSEVSSSFLLLVLVLQYNPARCAPRISGKRSSCKFYSHRLLGLHCYRP
ncbi:unnamed protein product [Nippostrongylus brasiliensis]|uniref:Uncharacterized protein n=1 Tax=Nippostrongylus brasiliensis TaxID=27835 RepID=A0A0N4XGA5_NIPBR|nr:unnamed protein product [Nippostrongylus brasiliensis]